MREAKQDYHSLIVRLRDEANFVISCYCNDCVGRYVNSPVVAALEEAAEAIEELLNHIKE